MVSLHWPPPPSMVITLLLLLVLPAITYGQASPEEILLYEFDGCPVEDASCRPLELNKTNQVVCPHSLWWGYPQLIYHTASNTTSVTTVWNPTKRVSLAKGVELWKAECEICPGDNQLLPGGKVVCSKDVPEVSVKAFTEQTGCKSGWRGNKCDEAYDPFGYENSGQQVTRYPAKPENAVEDKCNILLAEGCPDEAKDNCVKLRFFQDKQQQQLAYCPRKLWLSTDSKWEQIENLLCENEQWKIASKSSSNGTFLEPRRRIRCAHTQPAKTSVALNLWALGILSFGQGDLSIFFCFHNHLKCENGGHCMHLLRSGELETYCSCDSQHTGPNCEIEDIMQSPTNLFPLLMLDGCPIEAAKASKCQRLSVVSDDQDGRMRVVCPLKLWLSDITHIYHEASKTASVTTTWMPIYRVSRHYDKWWTGVNSTSNDLSFMDGSRKVICSSEMPNDISLAGFTQIDWGMRVDESRPLLFCPEQLKMLAPVGKECKHGYCISNTMRHLGCQCHFGWRGELCDIAFDPFGYENSVEPVARYTTVPDHYIRDRCDILLAEGCPDEATDDCIKLRLFRDAKYKLQAFCPRKLWLSGYSWESIDELWCDFQLSTWKIESKSGSSVTFLDSSSRVRCSHEKPTTPFYDLQRATLIQHSFGLVDVSSTFFCFRDSFKCENGGRCLHTLQNGEPTVTYCACGPQYSGDRCEIATPNYPPCSLLFVEGCPFEANRAWKRCERLRFNANSKAVECGSTFTMWASDVQLVYNSYSRTHSPSSNWTRIDKLWCKNNNWQISSDGQEATLTLGRKVVCSLSTPVHETDAFYMRRRFIPTPTNFNHLINSGPFAFCTDEVWKSGCPSDKSYCVISYVGEELVPSCSCNFGYSGEYCNNRYDPYGFEKYADGKVARRSEQQKDTVIDPCNILRAEGCPDMRKDNCVKLRYYNHGVICNHKLWVSKGIARFSWYEIDDLKCTTKGWVYHNSTEKVQLDSTDRVQCSWQTPITNTTGFEKIRPFSEMPDEGPGYTLPYRLIFYCMWNSDEGGRECEHGNHCLNQPRRYFEKDWPVVPYSNDERQFFCTCMPQYELDGSRWFVRQHEGMYCQKSKSNYWEDGIDEYAHLYAEDYKPHRSHIVHKEDDTVKVIETCDISELEDGCNDNRCKKLKANTTHVKCTKQLWLNYGSEFWLDWHEISGVKCVNNEWITECSKKIGQSHLVCSSSHPSPISSHLWVVIGVVGFLVILAIGLTCVICLICRRRRKFAQALADARTPHTSRCASSTQNSEMTTREE